MAHVTICEGDLLDQRVDAIVNAWNRNVFPWWLLLPQGVSGAIRRRAGLGPFRELARMGLIPLGGAVVTTAGKLPFQAIIHVAGIGLKWTSSGRSIRAIVQSALKIAMDRHFQSIAFPIIGAGTGGFSVEQAQALMLQEIETSPYEGDIRVVRFRLQREPC